MVKTTLFTFIKEEAKRLQSLELVAQGFTSSPYVNMNTPIAKSEQTACFYMFFKYKGQPHKTHLTVLAHYRNEFILRCGDPYFEGRFSKESANKMIEAAFEKVSSKNFSIYQKEMIKSFGTIRKSEACKFNERASGENPKDLCVHMRHMLSYIDKKVITQLEENYTKLFVGSSQTLDNMSAKISQVFQRYAFKKPILLEGDKGSGKTFLATKWTQMNKLKTVFVGGHEQFESIDFLGHYIQREDKSLVWKDGPLTQAFRVASAGYKVVLIIDEMLRIPQRELNILVSALSPISGHYILRTGRAKSVTDGIATEETLQAPVQNLWIIGTTNVGAGYAVEEIDDALADRFRTVRKDTTVEDMTKILLDKAKARGFSPKCVDPLLEFYKKMLGFKKRGTINRLVNIRHLAEAIEFAEKEKLIVEIIKDTILTWVERDYDGKPQLDQIQLIEMAIDTIWV